MIFRRVLYFIVFLSLALSIEAQNIDTDQLIDELRNAGMIIDQTSRLQQYDEILQKYGLRTSQPSLDTGKWKISVDTNPLDDSKKITFILKADSGQDYLGNPVVFIIRYNSNQTEIYINWQDYLGDKAYVTMRIGAEEATRQRWSLSTDSQATFYPGDEISLINKIIQVNRVVFQCTPYNESPTTAIFDVTGLRAAANQYIGDLGWW